VNNPGKNNLVQDGVLPVSIGICAYNEEKDIHYLIKSLLEQELERVFIKEIIIISDGCTDRTDQIVNKFNGDNRIKLIESKERRGKYIAVNKFLHCAKSPVLVLSSADIILSNDTIEKLCLPLLFNDFIGIIGARPVPQNTMDSFFGYVVNLQWYLHHKMSLSQPKFGELIAFRNIIDSLPPTLVDEEQIAHLIANKGYVLKYVPDALVYNKGPENTKDFLIQRRRIYAGHLMLRNNHGYEVTTLRATRILKCLLKGLPVEFKKNKFWLLGAIFLEMIGRAIGRADNFLNKDHYAYKWKIAKSTKGLKS